MKSLYLSIIVIVTSLVLPITFASGITSMPGPQFHAILDKNNYQNSEKPFLSIFAKPNATINLLVLDSHGLQKLDKNITLKNGTATYSFDISSYSPGICHVIVGDGTDEIKLDFSVGLMPTGGPRIDLLVSKPVYAPNEIIQITGFYRPSAIIHVDLITPNDVLQNSTLLQSDYLGNFQKKFVVPSNAINGTWKINATSGSVHGITYITIISKNYQENQIDPNNSGPPIPSYSSMTPLQQFKSGIAANDAKCEQGLQLVIRVEDSSPACVKSQTAQKLVEIGWGWAMQPIDSLKPLLPNRIAGLENDTGIVTFGNQTYYFETPHYIQNAWIAHPVQISFHDVVFTLFPSGFKGGLPDNICGSRYYWTDAEFSDGTRELLHIFPITSTSQQCLTLPEPTYFSNHTNPQAGLTFYNGKMKLLVRDYNQSSILQLDLSTNSTIIQSGQAIGIAISVNNPTLNPVQLLAQNNWFYGGVDTGPCARIGYGIAILDGHYETSNLTQGKNLPIFNPGVMCPFMRENAQMYEFQPASDQVKEIQCNQNPNMQCNPNSYRMGNDYGFAGYWHYGNIEPFKSGIYTVVGADEWGHFTIQHFTVINSTRDRK